MHGHKLRALVMGEGIFIMPLWYCRAWFCSADSILVIDLRDAPYVLEFDTNLTSQMHLSELLGT